MLNSSERYPPTFVAGLASRMEASRGHYFATDARYTAESLRKAFSDLDTAMRCLASMKEVRPLVEQFGHQLFGSGETSLFRLAYQDERSTIATPINDFPPSKRRFLSDQRSDQQLCLLEYFQLRFFGLIRTHSGNEFWQSFFLRGLNELFTFFIANDPVWLRRFLKDLEYSFIVELRNSATAPGPSGNIWDASGLLRFTAGLLPVFQFYVDSQIAFIKAEFWKQSKAMRQSKCTGLATDFLSALDVLATSLVGIAVGQKAVSFLQVADLFSRFLVVEGGDFGDFFREKTAAFAPRFLANLMVLAKDAGLGSPEHLTAFEQLAIRLARDDRGRHRRLLESWAGGPSHERSFLFGLFYDSVSPALGDRLLRSYEVVARELGDFQEEDLRLLVGRLDDVERVAGETLRRSQATMPETSLTEEDWNYPFDVSGEPRILFLVVLALARLMDWARGLRPVSASESQRMWRYFNGEKMWLNNPLLRGGDVPRSKLRWLAQWRVWTKVLAGLLILWLLCSSK